MADQELIDAIENKAGFTGSALSAATVLRNRGQVILIPTSAILYKLR